VFPSTLINTDDESLGFHAMQFDKGFLTILLRPSENLNFFKVLMLIFCDHNPSDIELNTCRSFSVGIYNAGVMMSDFSSSSGSDVSSEEEETQMDNNNLNSNCNSSWLTISAKEEDEARENVAQKIAFTKLCFLLNEIFVPDESLLETLKHRMSPFLPLSTWSNWKTTPSLTIVLLLEHLYKTNPQHLFHFYHVIKNQMQISTAATLIETSDCFNIFQKIDATITIDS